MFAQTAKAMVIGIERERRQLRLSEKVAEGEGQELAQKKALLMVRSAISFIRKRVGFLVSWALWRQGNGRQLFISTDYSVIM